MLSSQLLLINIAFLGKLKEPETDIEIDKQARNREAAKNSRIRKKIYIDLLEKKIEKLTQELEATKRQLDVKEHVESFISGYSAGAKLSELGNTIKLAADNVEKLLSADNSPELNVLIDSLRLRLCATGSARLKMISRCYKQIIDQILPTHLKYLLWSAKENMDLFYQDKETSISDDAKQNDAHVSPIWHILEPALNITDNQKKMIMKFKRKFVQEQAKLEELIQGLDKQRAAILKQMYSLQPIIDDLRTVLSPIQIGRFMFLMHKERNRKIFAASNLWKFTASQSDDEESDQELFEERTTPESSFPLYNGTCGPTPAFEMNCPMPEFLDEYLEIKFLRDVSNPRGK
eukprot:CAMPEP_0176461060 /NCGR_PEP_ID=MMETSP0127-20121128/34410_1 /TAXON_ID=938130 /ORGANISM="Platyophrya macrostoma, Strain WH" /LENGTH=346 /DNA_ID=CAMNT_0017852641 /DNA_START=188 /DNA_END=1227 /DNA_ORIENTATION=+